MSGLLWRSDKKFWNLNFHLPVVTKLFYWLRSQCSQPKLFILFAWFFFIGMLFRKNGKEISNVRNLLPDLHNNLSKFYKYLWLLEEKKDFHNISTIEQIAFQIFTIHTLYNNWSLSTSTSLGKKLTLIWSNVCHKTENLNLFWFWTKQTLNVFTFSRFFFVFFLN